MRKKPQIDTIAKLALPHLTHGRARNCLDAVLKEIAIELGETGAVRLPGFGVFEVKERKARVIRSPQGQPIALPATKEIRFRPARDLVQRVTGRRPS